MMRDKKVGVGARWRTRLQPKFLESDGALWNACRVLDHNDVASHQIGGGKAGELVVGKVPRLDAEEHSEGDTFDLGFARARLEGFRCKETLGVLGIVVDDVRAQSNFAPSLADELAHLERHQPSELVHTCTHNSGGSSNYDRSLGERRAPPCLEAG